MNRISRVAFAFAATTMGVLPPAHADFFKDLNRAVINVGKTVEKAVGDTGKTIEKAAHDTGHTVEKAAGDTGKTIEKAAHDTGHALEKGAHDTGHALEKATQDTGNALEKAAHDTGHALEDAGQFIKDHPWETVVAVALIAGGGYLVVYEGFTLSVTAQGVEVVKIACAATCGAVAGTGLTVAGVGTEMAAYYMGGTRRRGAGDSNQKSDDPSSPIGSDRPSNAGPATSETGPVMGTDRSTTQLWAYARPQAGSGTSQVFGPFDRPRIIVGSNPAKAEAGAPAARDGNASQAIKPVVVTNYGRSIMFEPRMAKNPSDMQRYSYAMWVRNWAMKTLPIDKFDPNSPNNISNVELKLLDAITALQSVEGAEDDKAEEQRRDRMNPLPSLALEQAIETNKEILWSVVKGQSTKEVFTIAKQLEIFRGASTAVNSSNVAKWIFTAGAPEMAGGLSSLGLISTGTAFGVLLSSTATSEGIKESSGALAVELRDQLRAYDRKRQEKFGKALTPPVRTVESVPQGPVLKAAP
ncbi:hypothetical protein [Bradyrhizobium sp. STM 3557]|uniref:hypothetical protein n=1 Tax=Bradyrhizobium sp. STM 3557 TaxID=578920 RepID=UPI00388EFDDE